MNRILKPIRISAALFAFAIAAAMPRNAAAAITKGPYLQNPRLDGIAICFEADAPVSGVLLYGSKPPPENEIKLDKKAFQEIKIDGLEPNSKYVYMLKLDDGTTEKGTFRTAKATDQSFEFLAYGDFREGPYEHALIKLMTKQKDAEFAVVTGDLMSDGREESLWDGFFRVVGPLIKKVPYFTVLGNHEQDSSLYFHYFNLPGIERWYSFDYGPARFITLDSNDGYYMLPEQTNWLKKTLKDADENPDIKFKIVFYHHPAYQSHPTRQPSPVRELWQPIFEQYGVDLVLNGHNHNYERLEVNGVKHVVTGGGGAGLYEFSDTPDPHSIVRSKEFHFMVIDVDQNKIAAAVINERGKEIDRFEIKR